MSVSAGGRQRHTTIIDTAKVDSGSSTEKSVDAMEDRKIVGLELSIEDLGDNDSSNAEAQVYTGNDPFNAADSVNDNESLAVSWDHIQNTDATNGLANTNEQNKYFSFEEHPFDWDEHVTLTVEWQQNQSASTHLEVIVHWVPA